MKAIVLMLSVVISQGLAEETFLSNLFSIIPGVTNLLSAFQSDEPTWVKDGKRSCNLPPEFIKAPDSAVPQVLSSEVFSDSQYSVFPPLGAIVNTGAYHCQQARYAVLTVEKTNGAYQARYWYGNGYLVNENPPAELVGTKSPSVGYRYALRQAFEAVVLGKEFTLAYNWGETCNSLNNKAEFSYQLGSSKRFSGYLNEARMKRTMTGKQVENRNVFLIAGPQKFSEPRHMTAAVSMSSGDNCDIDFFAIYSDVNEYFSYLDAYAQKYFNVTLDRKAAQDMLDASQACSQECGEENTSV